jgi:hypothetical protein
MRLLMEVRKEVSVPVKRQLSGYALILPNH